MQLKSCQGGNCKVLIRHCANPDRVRAGAGIRIARIPLRAEDSGSRFACPEYDFLASEFCKRLLLQIFGD